MIDKLIKISSVSGAFLIFCGVLKLIIFYSTFNIDIIDFLSFSEIVTSFLDDLNILLIFASIMIVQSLFIFSRASEKHEIKIEDYIESLLKHIFPFRYRYVCFFLSIIIILSALIYLNVLGLNYFVIYLVSFCLLQLLSFLIMTKDDNNEINYPNFPLAFSIAFVIITSIYLLAKYDIQEITNNENIVNITIDGSTIECNRTTNNIYLGKTDNYVFIKISTTNSCIAIPTKEINKFEFK
ncbi:hypothetical protein SL057_001381 [Flavobacterium psychrophilum]|nr:hypothetical protein [Flavobacterium psychrophilum]